MNATGQFISRNFSLVLILSFLLGLFLPGMDLMPKFTMLFFVGCLIFLACSKIDRADLKSVSIGHVALFYMGRFIVFPWIAYGVFRIIAPFYAHGALLLSLAPAGSSAPVLTTKAQGNTALALSMTILSTLLAPFVIPICFWIISGDGHKGGTGFAFNVWGIFFTLGATVFLPPAAYVAFAKNWPEKAQFTRENAAWMSTLGMAGVVALAVASQRTYFFRNPGMMVTAFVILIVMYAAYYAVGWFAPPRRCEQDRRAYAICSGANNSALAASVALFYLSPQDTLFMALSQAPWVAGAILHQKFMLRRKDS